MYSGGARSPDDFRNQGQKKTRAEVILFLLPVFEEIDRHAGGDAATESGQSTSKNAERATANETSNNYFIDNTDSRSITGQSRPRFPLLINHHFAALGGDRESYGEQFSQLAHGDTLLMYENGHGVVAIGNVSEFWDEKSFRTPRYYNRDEMGGLTGGEFEYRIAANWYLDLSQNPITLPQLRKQFSSPDFTPRGAVRRIVRHQRQVEALIAKLVAKRPMTRTAADYAPPPRVETTSYRVLRDTAKAIQVKTLLKYECQLRGHFIALPSGERYAEAHHIKPLGRPHEGPDVIENIICVCPNHHAELDYGVFKLSLSAVRQADGHRIGREFVEDHNRSIFAG